MAEFESSENVWISREEYDRLRNNQTTTASTPATVTADSTPFSAAKEEKKAQRMQTILGVVLAIMLLISMTNENLSAFSLLPVSLFAIFAIMSLIDYLRKRHSSGTIFGSPINPTSTADPAVDAKHRSSRYKLLLIIALILIALPILAPIAFILFFLVLAAFGGGDIGS